MTWFLFSLRLMIDISCKYFVLRRKISTTWFTAPFKARCTVTWSSPHLWLQNLINLARSKTAKPQTQNQKPFPASWLHAYAYAQLNWKSVVFVIHMHSSHLRKQRVFVKRNCEIVKWQQALNTSLATLGHCGVSEAWKVRYWPTKQAFDGKIIAIQFAT